MTKFSISKENNTFLIKLREATSNSWKVFEPKLDHDH